MVAHFQVDTESVADTEETAMDTDVVEHDEGIALPEARFVLSSKNNSVVYKSIYFRLTQFKSSLQQMFRKQRAQSLTLTHIQQNINTDSSEQRFTPQEVTGALNQMTEENQVMLADGIVFLI